MPDGTVIKNVPPGTKQSDLQTRLAKMRKPATAAAPLQSYTGPVEQARQDVSAEASEVGHALRPNIGKGALEAVGALDIPFRAAGNAVMDATGSPAAATAAYALPQMLGPQTVVKAVERAVKLGKVSREAAPKFAELLKQRLATEGKTGWTPTAEITDEQADVVAAMLRSKDGSPSAATKPIKSAQQKAGARQRIPAGEEGFPPEASDLSDMDAHDRAPPLGTLPDIPPTAEVTMGKEPDVPVKTFPKETYPEVIDPAPEPRPTGTKPVKPTRLPKELSKASPRYAFGQHQFEIAFDSDVDRAAYITAQKTPSKRDNDFLKFAMEATGMTAGQVRAYGAQVRAKIKENAQAIMVGHPAPHAGLNLRTAVNKPKEVSIDYDNESLLQAIKKLGGLHVSHARDISGEKGFRANAGNAGMWKKDGLSIDDMVTQLGDHGYIPPEALNDADGGVQWLRDAVKAEMDGHKVYSMKGDEAVIYGRMRDEGGKINPALVTKLATTTTGAIVGAGLDPEHPIHGAILGAAGGFGAGHIVTRRVISGGFGSALRVADNPGKLLHDAKEGEIVAGQRAATQTFEKLKSANLTPDRGFAVIRAVETGDVSALLPQEIQVAQLFSDAVGKLGTRAQEAGVIANLRKNYAPLLFDWSDPHTAATLRKMGATDPAKGERTSGFSTFTPFQLERTITDYGMAQKLGLKPATLDPAELFRRYASSVIRATENKRAITELANLKGEGGRPVVGLQGTVPDHFVPINKGDVKIPELDGFMVDPDIADSVRAGLSSYDPSIIARSAMNVSWFAKRFNVSLSAFHPMALLQAHAGAGGNPFDVLAGVGARGVEKATGIEVPYKSAVDKALEAYRMGGENDAVDALIRNGLKIEAPLEDRSGRDAFQKTMKLTGDKVKDLLGHEADLAFKGLGVVDNGLQKFTWDYMYTGMKLSTGMKMLEQEVQRNITRAAAGKEPLKPVNQIAADVSSFVNSTFGGLNLRRIAEDVAKEWGPRAGSAAYSVASPRGQAYLQMAVFAPDWKMSTLQAWTRGLGLTGNETVQRFHREYLVRSAMMSMILADAVNMKMSGHHVWQNDFHTKRGHQQTTLEKVHDATYVDLGDGRKMQMFKHLMEGPHAVSDPQKFALNAMGYIPRTAGTLLTNKQFMTPEWAPPIAENHLGPVERAYKYATWPLHEASPIAAMNFDAGMGATAGSFLGTPIYGSTQAQKQKRAQERLEEKARSMLKR